MPTWPGKKSDCCAECGKMNCMEHGGKVEKSEGMSHQGRNVREAKDRMPMESTSHHGFRSKMKMGHAKEIAQERMDSEKMIHPKMKGLAHGGEVEEHEMHDEMEPEDDSIHDALAEELHHALESKDKKQIIESMRALIMSCKE